MKKSRIRRYVFVPVAIGLLVLTAIITGSLHWYQSQHLEETVSTRLMTVTRAFGNQVKSDANLLDGLIEFLKREPALQQAYLSGDRDRLLKAAMPIFQEMQAAHRVTHFYFCDPARTTFLRVHEPTRHGDVVDRYTALAAETTGKPSRGVELGPLGTLTLRVVHPWKVDNRLIGYVELGEEISHLLPRIESLADVQLIVTIDKANLNRNNWEAGRKMLKRRSSWSHFDKIVIADSTMPRLPQSVEALLCMSHSEHNGRILGAAVGDTLYRGGLLPLIDAGGRDVGDLVTLIDVTWEANALRKTLVSVVAATLVFFALLSWLFWTYLGRLQRSLAATTEELRLAKDVAEQAAVRLSKLSRAVEQCPVGITITALHGVVEFSNPGFSRITGYPVDELVGANTRILLDTRVHSPDFEAHIQDTLLRGDTWQGEMCMRKKSGETFWGNTTIAPIFDRLNEVTHCVGITIDITDKRKASEELLEYAGSLAKASAEIKKQAKELAISELKYRTLFDSSRDAIMVLTPDEGFLDGNSATVRLFGCKDVGDFTTHSPADLSPERQADGSLSCVKAREMMTLALESGSNFFEWIHARCDGSVFPATVLLTRLELEGKTVLQATVRDTTQEQQVAEALRVAKEGAEAASRAKSAFLANISHELRTPLHGVVGMTELLKGTPLEDRQRQFVDACHTSGKSLLELINDVLDFSKIEAGRLELESREFELRPAVLDAVESMRFQAEHKGLTLVAQVAAQADGRVRGDDARLRQVLLNLIGNAVKFTDAGEIVVRVEPAEPQEGENAVRFEVADQGIGIAPDRIDRLFRSFSQADASVTRKYGGTGLGLAISKRLIELMGGRIGVASQLGHGSTFWFAVPLQPCQMESPQAGSSAAASSRFPQELDRLLQGRKALLVEDNYVNRMFAQEVLRQAGMTCHTVESGLQAIDSIRREPFDVVLMDCQMPEMDGFKTTQRIRELERNGQLAGRTPIVALTANAIKGDRERCLASGMDDYIAKPFGSQDLLEMVGRLLTPASGRAAATSAGTPAETAAATDDAQPIDRDDLLMRCRGNIDFALSLLTDFEGDLPNRVEQIVGDVLQRDSAAAIESAHALKGAAGTMAANRLRAVAAEIEAAGKSGELADPSAMADRLRNEAERCLQYIPELRQQIGNPPATPAG